MPLDNISELRRRVPGGKYTLTRAVAERARQLQEGAPPLTPVRIANPLSVAIDEIVQGKISFQVEVLNHQAPSSTAAPAQDDPTTELLPVEPQKSDDAADAGNA